MAFAKPANFLPFKRVLTPSVKTLKVKTGQGSLVTLGDEDQ